jgi:hypothetical protein
MSSGLQKYSPGSFLMTRFFGYLGSLPDRGVVSYPHGLFL